MCCVFGGIIMVCYVGIWRRCKYALFGIHEKNPAEWRLETSQSA